jgi:hypothetical protein
LLPAGCWRFPAIYEKWRIAYHQIEQHIATKILKRGVKGLHTILKRIVFNIFSGNCTSLIISFNANYFGFTPLRHHKGNHTRAGANIQYVCSTFNISPGTKQNAIGANPMDVLILTDVKLLELKDVQTRAC